jgi:hypothetical protein
MKQNSTSFCGLGLYNKVKNEFVAKHQLITEKINQSEDDIVIPLAGFENRASFLSSKAPGPAG